MSQRQHVRRTVRRLCGAMAVAVVLAGCVTEVADRSRSQPPGQAQTASAAAADDARAGWQELPAAPLSPRQAAVGLWLDEAFMVIGGRVTPPCPPGADCPAGPWEAHADGARYDPQLRTWTPIAPAPIAVAGATTAVVGDTAYLWQWAGPGHPRRPRAVLAYDAGDDRWQRLPAPNDPPAHRALVGAGRHGVIAVLDSHEGAGDRDLILDPATNEWSALPGDPLAPSFDRRMAVVGDQAVLLAQPLVEQPNSAEPSLVRAAALDLRTRQWRRLPDSEMLGHGERAFAVGTQVIDPSAGGADGGNSWGRRFSVGGILDLAQERWVDLPPAPEPGPGDTRLSAAGDEALLVNTLGYAYEPARRRWTALRFPAQAGEDGQAVAVGDGTLFLWGGVRWSDSGALNARGWSWAPQG